MTASLCGAAALLANESLNLPLRYGTKNCYDCGAEPVLSAFWERFIFIDGVQWSVPQCDICANAMYQNNQKAHE